MRLVLLLTASIVAFAPNAAVAAVTVFAQDQAGFDAAAGSPPVAVDFDSIAPGTDIGGMTIGGLTFMPSATGAALIVVKASDTTTHAGSFSGVIDASTNVLPATSGANVLSPGGTTLGPGPDPAVENDDLVVTFTTPVSAVGFDLLSQSADGFSGTSITVFDGTNAVLFSGAMPISNLGGGGAPAGADFWGIVSDANDIARVEVDENDSNAANPDSNVGYDTFRVASLGGSTTTTVSSTTTTTTIEGECGATVTLVQLDCRLDLLHTRLTASDVGKLAGKLGKELGKAVTKKQQAESACAGRDTKRAQNALKKSERQLIGFSHVIRSLTGRRTITDAALRNELAGTADGIRRDMKTLRGHLTCP